MKQWLVAVLSILVIDWVSASQPDIHYSNIWEAEIDGGEEVAKKVANDLGYTYHGKLKSFDNRYVVTKDGVPEQSKSKSDHFTEKLKALNEVKWAVQHPTPGRMEDPEASMYLRKLCSVIEPPNNYGAQANSAPSTPVQPYNPAGAPEESYSVPSIPVQPYTRPSTAVRPPFKFTNYQPVTDNERPPPVMLDTSSNDMNNKLYSILTNGGVITSADFPSSYTTYSQSQRPFKINTSW